MSDWIDDREEIKSLIMTMTLGFIGPGFDGMIYYSRADKMIHIVIQKNGEHDHKNPRELDELDSLIDRMLRSGLRFYRWY